MYIFYLNYLPVWCLPELEILLSARCSTLSWCALFATSIFFPEQLVLTSNWLWLTFDLHDISQLIIVGWSLTYMEAAARRFNSCREMDCPSGFILYHKFSYPHWACLMSPHSTVYPDFSFWVLDLSVYSFRIWINHHWNESSCLWNCVKV